MFIIYVIDLSIKKFKDGGSYFYKTKLQTVVNRKKNFFSVNSFQKILIFHICTFSENAQCFVGALL